MRLRACGYTSSVRQPLPRGEWLRSLQAVKSCGEQAGFLDDLRLDEQTIQVEVDLFGVNTQRLRRPIENVQVGQEGGWGWIVDESRIVAGDLECFGKHLAVPCEKTKQRVRALKG